MQKTLPNFFSTGLVAIGSHSFTSALHLPNLHSLGGLLDPKGKGKARAEDEGEFAYNSSVHDIGGLEEEIIYSNHIRLEYTPPVVLPAPFPRTLFIEGMLRCCDIIAHSHAPLSRPSSLCSLISIHSTYCPCVIYRPLSSAAQGNCKRWPHPTHGIAIAYKYE